MINLYSNSRFRALLDPEIQNEQEYSYDFFEDPLNTILKKGLIFKDGGLFLSANVHNAKVTPGHFFDRTAYECFVNKLHLEDADLSALTRSELNMVCIRAIHFLLAVASAVEKLPGQGSYRFILSINLSIDDGGFTGCVFRFHTLRQGEFYLDENLELYTEEAILVLDLIGGVLGRRVDEVNNILEKIFHSPAKLPR